MIHPLLNRWRQGIERRLEREPAERFWKRNATISLEQAHGLIRSAVTSGQPFCAARLGGVEQKIVLWGRHIHKVGCWGMPVPVWFSDTQDGATNAGIRPRNPASYKAYADLAFESLEQVDLLAKWNMAGEFAILKNLKHIPALCDVEHLSPTMSNDHHWLEALDGKRVLIVSPFKTSIERQIERMNQIWEKRSWKWRAEFVVQKFPYLIDDDCDQTWLTVYQEMLSVIHAGRFDVALFGCGGLGLPLAAAAKSCGRVGIHMGGHLQLLFGIFGQRHLEQDWHARWINDAWIRPDREEVAHSAKRVEGGCYW